MEDAFSTLSEEESTAETTFTTAEWEANAYIYSIHYCILPGAKRGEARPVNFASLNCRY